MVKTILITLVEDVPDYTIGEDAIVSIGETSFGGKVVGIVVHEEDISTTVTLEGKGLKVTPP